MDVAASFQAWSEDNGETWSRLQSTALAPSTAPAQIRTRISSAISRNGGSVWKFFQNVESMHEETHVEPGPIRPVRTAEYHFEHGLRVPEREREHILPVGFHGRWSYPLVFVMKDRVLIVHTYSVYEQHPTRAELILSSRKPGSFNQKLKVLPLTWFYGGKEPVAAPFLLRAHESASP